LLASFLLFLISVSSSTYANVVGSQPITTHDYLAPNDLGSCGIPYSCLDVTRVTAVQALDKSVDCGTCIKVTCTSNPAKFVYVVAIDTGGQGLDLSTPSFQDLFGINTGIFPASWAPTNPRNCLSVWRERPPSSLALPGAHTILNDIGNTSPPPMNSGNFFHGVFSGEESSHDDLDDIPMTNLNRRQLAGPPAPVIGRGFTMIGMNPSVSSASTTSLGSSPTMSTTTPSAGVGIDDQGVGSAIQETQASPNDFVVNGTAPIAINNTNVTVHSTSASLAVNPTTTMVLSASMLLAWSMQ